MRQDQRIGLTTMDKRHGHPGIGHVKQAALPLDQIPVVGVIIRREIFHRPGHEIGNHRIQWHAVAGDQNAGLASGTKRGLHAAFDHLGFHRHRRIHLANRAIRAHGQTALAGTFHPSGNRIANRGHAHVMQGAAIGLRGGHQITLIAQQVMQA